MSNLILMRHGQSIWNLQNRFTGGIDVPLTRKGISQAKRAGQELKKMGIHIDVVFSSKLSRSIETAKIAIKNFNGTEMEQCVVVFCNNFPIFSGEMSRTTPKPSKEYRNRSETLINRKISVFCIEAIP